MLRYGKRDEQTIASCKRGWARENEGICSPYLRGVFPAPTLGLRHRVMSRLSCLFLEARSLRCTRMDAPGGHISVCYRLADTFVLEED